MAVLIEHMEKFLGRIRGGGPAGRTASGAVVSVAEYEPAVQNGPIHYSTIGLSKIGSDSDGQDGRALTEFLMSSSSREASSVMGSILAQVTKESLEDGRPPSLGDVLGPRGQMFEGSEMEAVYVRKPDHISESFCSFQVGENEVQVLWLAPITKAEAQYIRLHGAIDFELLVQQEHPDFENVKRKSLV